MSKQIKMTFVAAAVLAVAAGLSSGAAYAAPNAAPQPVSIAAVKAASDAGITELRLGLSAPLTKAPQVFSMSNPARVVFDVPGTVNGTGQRLHEIGQGDVQNVTLIQAQGITRVIVQLKNAATPVVDVAGNELVLKFGQESGVAQTKQFAAAVPAAAGATAGAAHALAAVDFRRGPANEGRVIVDLANSNTGIEIRQQAGAVTVDFQDASIAEQLLRKLNVTDFGTPVKNVTLARFGKGVRMTVEPTGLWEYNAYQTDQRFVMEVRPVKYDPNKLVQGSTAGYKGEKMSLNFQNVDVRNLLSVIADFTKLNIVSSDTVQGSMTIRLQDVPWDQALDLVLQARGLDMRKNGSVIWVAPAEEIAKREKEKLENAAQTTSLEPLRTQSFQLNYTKADEVIKLLTNKDQKLLSARGSVVSDPRTNQIFVQDNNTSLGEVSRIIEKIDVPVRQVMIEARIVEATDKFSRALGARLGFAQAYSPGNRVNIGGTTSATGYQTGQISDVPDFLTQGQSINLPAPALESGAQAASFALTLMNSAGTKFLNLELSALEADGRGKIVSSPSVVTSDKEKALIEQGTEIPYLEASSAGATSVSFRKATLKLEVVPQITPDGNVIMAVKINKDAPGTATVSGISIDTKRVQTQVLVENGGTVVIGGIFTQEERTDVNKVPFLGDLPLIGNAFKNSVKKDNKTELMIFLTPRILDSRVGSGGGK